MSLVKRSAVFWVLLIGAFFFCLNEKEKPKIFEINKNVKHDGYLLSLEKDQQYFKSNYNESS